MAEQGRQLPQNLDVALESYRRSALQGYAPAYLGLGELLYRGRRNPCDVRVANAVGCYAMAAEMANRPANPDPRVRDLAFRDIRAIGEGDERIRDEQIRIYVIQRLLGEFGDYHGEANGTWNRVTDRAIADYRRNNGFKPVEDDDEEDNDEEDNNVLEHLAIRYAGKYGCRLEGELIRPNFNNRPELERTCPGTRVISSQ